MSGRKKVSSLTPQKDRKKRVLKATKTHKDKLRTREHTAILIQEQLTLFRFHKTLETAFRNKIRVMRDRIGVPELFKEDDCSPQEFQTRDYFIGIDSLFLKQNPTIRRNLEQAIYKERVELVNTNHLLKISVFVVNVAVIWHWINTQQQQKTNCHIYDV